VTTFVCASPAVDRELPLLVKARARQHRAGRELEERLEAAAIQGKVLDEAPVDDRAHGARGRALDVRVERVHDRHGLADLADLQAYAERLPVADVEHDVADFERGEAVALRRQSVAAGRQQRDDERALAARRHVALDGRAQTQHGYLDRRHDRAVLVEHRPRQRRRRRLRARRRRRREQQRRRQQKQSRQVHPPVRLRPHSGLFFNQVGAACGSRRFRRRTGD
jgi:hypothetical protein